MYNSAINGTIYYGFKFYDWLGLKKIEFRFVIFYILKMRQVKILNCTLNAIAKRQ